MEQWPHLFIERVKKELISKFFNNEKLVFAENHWRYFDYHGIAMLRDYYEDKKIKLIQATAIPFEEEPCVDGRIVYDDNSVLSHRFAYRSKKDINYSTQDMKLLFTGKNSIINGNKGIKKNSHDEFFNFVVSNEIHECKFNDKKDEFFIYKKGSSKLIHKIEDSYSKKYSDSIQDFDEHHSAIICIFDNIIKGKHMKSSDLYHCLLDLQLVNNLKYSAYNGVVLNGK